MKKILFVVLLLAVALSGCLPKELATPTATPTTASRPAPATTLIVPSDTQLLPDSGCTVISKKPTPGPTAESIYPPVGESDHVKGPASAKVTIIEYSDFQ